MARRCRPTRCPSWRHSASQSKVLFYSRRCPHLLGNQWPRVAMHSTAFRSSSQGGAMPRDAMLCCPTHSNPRFFFVSLQCHAGPCPACQRIPVQSKAFYFGDATRRQALNRIAGRSRAIHGNALFFVSITAVLSAALHCDANRVGAKPSDPRFFLSIRCCACLCCVSQRAAQPSGATPCLPRSLSICRDSDARHSTALLSGAVQSTATLSLFRNLNDGTNLMRHRRQDSTSVEQVH